MARPLRINREGGWYHVTARGTERRALFDDARTYRHFLELLEEMVTRYQVRLHAYVMMSNHFHLVLETPQGNLSAAMQWLKTSYAMWYNRRRGRVGPLFAGRFKAVLFEGGMAAWPISRYVHLNPVRVLGLGLGKAERKAEARGLCPVAPPMIAQRRKTLYGYEWSSYACYMGRKPTPDWLLVEPVLGSDGRGETVREQRRAYRAYVEGELGTGAQASPLEEAVGGLLYGSRAWVEGIRQRLKGDRREQTAWRHAGRPDWACVRQAVEQVQGEHWERFVNRHGDTGRDLALFLGRRHAGMSLKALGVAAGMDNYYAVAQAIARFAHRCQAESRLRQALQQAMKCMKIKT